MFDGPHAACPAVESGINQDDLARPGGTAPGAGVEYLDRVVAVEAPDETGLVVGIPADDVLANQFYVLVNIAGMGVNGLDPRIESLDTQILDQPHPAAGLGEAQARVAYPRWIARAQRDIPHKPAVVAVKLQCRRRWIAGPDVDGQALDAVHEGVVVAVAGEEGEHGHATALVGGVVIIELQHNPVPALALDTNLEILVVDGFGDNVAGDAVGAIGEINDFAVRSEVAVVENGLLDGRSGIRHARRIRIVR